MITQPESLLVSQAYKKVCTAESMICQGCLWLTPGSMGSIMYCLNLTPDRAHHILWVGGGNAMEITAVVLVCISRGISVHIHAIEKSAACIELAQLRIAKAGIDKHVTMVHACAEYQLQSSGLLQLGFTHLYTTATTSISHLLHNFCVAESATHVTPRLCALFGYNWSRNKSDYMDMNFAKLMRKKPVVFTGGQRVTMVSGVLNPKEPTIDLVDLDDFLTLSDAIFDDLMENEIVEAMDSEDI